MKRVSWSLAFLFALTLGFSSSAFAAEGSVTIQSIVYGGTGCPQGSAAVTIAPDHKTFRIVFDRFVALAGGDIPIVESRKACTINVNAVASAGFTWGLGRASYRGQAQIANGGSGLHRTIYFFQGQAQQATASHAFMSPFSGAWRNTDTFDADEALFAPCGVQRALNINTSVRVTGGPGPTDGSFVVLRAARVFELLVKSCS